MIAIGALDARTLLFMLENTVRKPIARGSIKDEDVEAAAGIRDRLRKALERPLLVDVETIAEMSVVILGQMRMDEPEDATERRIAKAVKIARAIVIEAEQQLTGEEP